MQSAGRSVVSHSVTPWTIESMEFSRPEHWSGQPFPSPGIFPTQGSNPGLPHCGQILFQLSHKGSPRILEWVAYPFSGGSSWPRNQTGVSCIAGRFFTNWAIRKATKSDIKYPVGINIFIYAENILYETYGERHRNNLKLNSKYIKLKMVFSYILSYIK